MKKVVGGVAAVVATVALAALTHYALVWDGFAPRSKQGGYYSIGRWSFFDLSHLDEWNKAAKEKYGPRSSTAIRGKNWEAYVEGKVVETRAFSSKPAIAYGVFMVPQKASYPFEVSIDPQHIPDPEFTTENIKRYLVGKIPAQALEFDAQDWRLAHCHSPEAPSFGILNPALRLGPLDVCLIRLKSERSGTLVIGYAVVYGELWTRPLSKRICRILAASWVKSMMSRPGVNRPDFVGCLLANRANETSDVSAETPSPHFFEVRDDTSVAVLD
ncbi:hypothetical protein [Bradyrhizobium ivorense]|uniref:hypothetical protein n=1 Tax=Bradyrhizobium ivorense TaxID=2511166 RepID=UPI0010B5880C|nr:hypothetical protein [Bradyrhizobium ivorense]VIO76281.1 hypothetical protein CI41S_51940 [Bradyrhizobium ivorense]